MKEGAAVKIRDASDPRFLRQGEWRGTVQTIRGERAEVLWAQHVYFTTWYALEDLTGA